MKKQLRLFPILILTAVLLMFSSAVKAQAKWTFMVYLDADNDLESFGMIDFNEMEAVGSTAEVNIVVQIDRIPGYDNSNGNWTGARRYKITKDANTSQISSTMIQDLGEVNMGDPVTLTSFINWATTNYPADNFALVLWDHGGGWAKKKSTLQSLRNITPLASQGDEDNGFKSFPFHEGGTGKPFQVSSVPAGNKYPASLRNLQHGVLSPANVLKSVCVDQTSGDHLTNYDVSSAIDAANEYINLIGFDACLMAMIEIAYPLKDLGDVLVGSEDVEPGDGWPYDQILAALIATPTMTPSALGSLIVNEYAEFYNSIGEATTQSAIDLNQIAGVAQKLNDFTAAITSNNTLWDELDQLRTEVDKFNLPEHKDLWHIAHRMQQLSSVTTVDDAAAALKGAIENCVIDFHASAPNFSNSKGIAIYFPAATDYNPHYGEAANNINFMAENQWDEFLIAYFNGGSGGTGTDDPDIDYGTDIYEPNNNFGLAYGPMINDVFYNGYLLDETDLDIFRLEIPEESDITITLTVPADFDLYLLQPVEGDFSVIAFSEQGGTSTEVLAGIIDAGVYYLAVTTFETHTSNYTLKVTGINNVDVPVLYSTTLAYDFGDPTDYIWGTTLGDAAACMYSPPSVPAKLEKIWLNLQDLDAGNLGGDGTFYLFAEDYYGSLLYDTIRMLTPPDTGWLYYDLSAEEIYIYGDFLVAIMYDGFNTPGIGYDNTTSFGNNLFFSTDYPDGYEEDPGTYFIRAEISYLISPNTPTGGRTEILDPVSVAAFPNPFTDDTDVRYMLQQAGDIDITLTDVQGRIVLQQSLKNRPPGEDSYRITGTDLPSGLYILRITSEGKAVQWKLLKQ